MDWLDKIPKWIQIPLKILLPALCIFSGFIMFSSDGLIEKLYLKEFRQETGFAFGLIFVVTLSLILVYIIFFASKPIIGKFQNKRLRWSVKRQIRKLHGAEKLVLYGLYNEHNHAYTFPMNDPTVHMLSARGYLFTYNQQADVHTYDMQFGMIYMLQPIIVDSITKILKDDAYDIIRIQDKIKKCKDKDQEKKQKLEKELENAKKYLKNIKSLSLDKYYGGKEQWIN